MFNPYSLSIGVLVILALHQDLTKMASPIKHMPEVLNFASIHKQLAFEMASTSRHRLLHARDMDFIIENTTKDDSAIAAACHPRLDLPISYYTLPMLCASSHR